MYFIFCQRAEYCAGAWCKSTVKPDAKWSVALLSLFASIIGLPSSHETTGWHLPRNQPWQMSGENQVSQWQQHFAHNISRLFCLEKDNLYKSGQSNLKPYSNTSWCLYSLKRLWGLCSGCLTVGPLLAASSPSEFIGFTGHKNAAVRKRYLAASSWGPDLAWASCCVVSPTSTVTKTHLMEVPFSIFSGMGTQPCKRQPRLTQEWPRTGPKFPPRYRSNTNLTCYFKLFGFIWIHLDMCCDNWVTNVIIFKKLHA